MRKVQIFVLATLVLTGCSKKAAVSRPPQTPSSPTATANASNTAGASRQAAALPARAQSRPEGEGDRALTSALDNLNAVLEHAFFDFDRYSLRSDATAALTKDATVVRTALQTDRSLKLKVEGHSDERGSAEYNLALADRRAHEAKEFLSQLGIPADRVETASFGEERPLCTEATEDCWQKNRRAHVSYRR
ncbi:MAG TPA: OmpA family protein [Bryobacteraceae bacterium]|nr:OmpA family protein [Bryobacteraceae bacterium]